MNVQHIDGLATFMDLCKISKAIIPLTMTELMQWHGQKDNGLNMTCSEGDMKQVIRKIQRLEPFEYEDVVQLETNCASALLLHAAAWSGHDELIRRMLSID
eukprot:PhF_6_TR35024/c1_g2_i1/m.51016